MIAVDTNIIAYLYLPSKKNSLAEELLKSESVWVAPSLWRSEFRNVLALHIRKRVISVDVAIEIAEEAERQFRGHEYDVASLVVLSLTAESGCSAYDCEFVAVAEALRIPLVTEDKTVARKFPDTASSLAHFLGV